MATLSARAQLLRDERNKYATLSRFGSAIKIPSASSQASTIAKQAATAELQTKTDQYNNGTLSPDEMLAYLKTASNNSTFSLQEKGQIQNTISNFQDKVNEGKLQAAYKNTQPNSTERAQAAKSLADFYSNQADSMAASSPAQSTALQNAGDWQNQAKTEMDNVQKAQRSLDRAQKLNQIALTTDPNSIDNAQKTADAYQQLAQEAAADGDQNQAYQFSTKAQDAANRIQVIQANEQKKVDAENKKTLMDYIDNTYNDYQDGKISGDQALANLQAADGQAAQIGDTSVQLHLNSLATTIQRNEDRGVTFTNDGAFGTKTGGGTGELFYDPTTGTLSGGSSSGGSSSGSGSVSRSTSSGSGGTTATTGAGNSSGGIASPKTAQAAAKLGLPAQGGPGVGPVTLQEMDYTYANNKQMLQSWLMAGKDVKGNLFNAQNYTQALAALESKRATALSNITAQLSQVDPNIKVKYGTTTKTIGALLEGDGNPATSNSTAGYKDQLKTTIVEADQLNNGDLVPVMVTKTGPNGTTPTIELQSKDNFQQYDPASQQTVQNPNYMQDASGVYYEIQYKRQYLTPQQAASVTSGYYNSQKATQDKSGAYYVSGTPYVDIYDTNGNRIVYYHDQQYGWLADPTSTNDGNLQVQLKVYNQTIQKEAQAYAAVGQQPPINAPMNLSQFQDFSQSGELGKREYGSIYNTVNPQKPDPNAPTSLGGLNLNQQQTLAQKEGIAVKPPATPNLPGLTDFIPGQLPKLPVVQPVAQSTSQPLPPGALGVVGAQPLRLPIPAPLGSTGTFNPSTGNLTPTRSNAQSSAPQAQQPLKIVGNQPTAPVNNSGVNINLGTPPSNNTINSIPAVPKQQPQGPNLLDQLGQAKTNVGNAIGSFFGRLF